MMRSPRPATWHAPSPAPQPGLPPSGSQGSRLVLAVTVTVPTTGNSLAAAAAVLRGTHDRTVSRVKPFRSWPDSFRAPPPPGRAVPRRPPVTQNMRLSAA
eukprot:317748-Hanusia_phi.AAC.1